MRELMNVVSIIIIGNNNYLIDTGEFFKKTKVDDCRKYFENLLLFDCLNDKRLTNLEADYLLANKNYNFANVDEFKNAFQMFRKKILKK